jgi:rhodanese-related sulfurtransferase
MLSRFLTKFATSSGVPAVTHEELVQAHQKGTCTVVDVREAREYASGHIPGAINHPLSQFDPARIPRGKPVVLLCQAGSRSTAAMHRVIAAGRQDGGIIRAGWRSRRGPLG